MENEPNGTERDESSNIGELAQALAKAQGAFPAVAKSSEAELITKAGQKIRYSYADLASIWDAIRAPLAANGLAVVQVASSAGPEVVVTTTLMHASGQWIRGRLSMPVAMHTPQAFGSAITYAKKYSLAAMVGVATTEEDDDGAAASETVPRPQASPVAPRQPAQAHVPASPPTSGKRSAEVKQAARRVTIQETPPEPPPPTEADMPFLPPNSDSDGFVGLDGDSGDNDPGEPPVLVPFGRNKGKPLSDTNEKDLRYLAEYADKAVNDPGKAKFRESNEKLLHAVQRELSRR